MKQISTDNDLISYNNDKESLLIVFPNLKKWVVSDSNTNAVLSFLKTPHTFDELVDEISNTYKLKRDDIITPLNDLVNYLIKNNIIFESRELYTNIVNNKAYKLKHDSVYIEITSLCNLRCKHCFGDFGEVEISSISLDKFKLLINDFKKMGIKNIILSGGEPLLHPNFNEFMDVVLSENFILNITANGLIFNNHLYDLYCSNDRVRIQYSLEGITKEVHEGLRGKGCFDLIMSNIKKFISAGDSKRISISTSVYSGNLNFL